MEKRSRRKKQAAKPELEQWTEGALITADSGQKYTLEGIKVLYTLSKESIQEFSERLNLPCAQIRKHALAGDWDKIRDKNSREELELRERIAVAQMAEACDTEIQVQALQNLQLKSQLSYLMEYVATWGDLFARDPESGEILKDGYGSPLTLKLPTSFKAAMERKGQHEIIQGLLKMLESKCADTPKRKSKEASPFSGKALLEASRSALDEE